MAWKVSKVEEQRKQLIDSYHDGKKSLADICRQFGISRKTAYKWLARYQQEGSNGLKDRSKAPHHQNQKTNEEVINHIIALKHQREAWGLGHGHGHAHGHEREVMRFC